MTSVSEMKIRLAGPDDIEALTDLHWASFDRNEHLPVMLGKRYVKATYKWHVKSPNAYALVAELDKQIVGLVGVSDTPFTWPMFKACLFEFTLSLVRNPLLVFEKKLWARVFRRSEEGESSRKIFGLPGVAQMTIGAVDSRYRGLGIFDRLIESTKETSKARGSCAIVGGVYKKNVSSRKVFIKSGWEQTSALETSETVFYVAFLDSAISKEMRILFDVAGSNNVP